MTRSDIIEYCLTFPASYEDYPFDDALTEGATAVMRHRGNKKSFALIMLHDGKQYLNVKSDPFEADFLRQIYRDIIPGWHMNHTHWNTIVFSGDCDVPKDEIKKMIAKSYDLIKPKLKKRV